jgi:RNA polymerase sigma factor (sigma-70 family)
MPNHFDTNPAVDEQLLADVLLGDDRAAHILVIKLGPIIRRVADRIAPSDLREDLIQEVWTHLWSNNCRVLQRWDRRGPLVHYVAVVASNRMRDHLARCKIPTIPINDCPDHPDPDNPGLALEVRQLRDCLEKAKGHLSKSYRDLIYMRHELGLKHKEIAANLGKTIGYVGSTLARAERHLREKLVQACADHLGSFRSIF